MTKLSVNINKIATIRNARGGKLPDVIKAAQAIESFGADGITVHPRPDGRHIKYEDVYALKEVVRTEFNVEGYPESSFLKMVGEIKPTQVTLVPDPPDVLTSNSGWDIVQHHDFLAEVIQYLKKSGIRVSVFVNPDVKMIEHALRTGTDRVELYTEQYASRYAAEPNEAIKPYLEAALKANELKLGINAGHDLNLENLKFFSRMIPNLLEVSIGHALISDALYFGLEKTIELYKNRLKS